MKKVLLASTALVGLAGMAAAEVSISGSAELGIVGGSRYDDNVQFFNDVDVTFSMTGETDGGLQFGVSVDLDEAATLDPDSASSFDSELDDIGGYAIFISGNFGRVTVGDTDGALDFALQEINVGHPGSIDDSETEHPGFFGSYHDGAGFYDGQIVRYEYSFDAFTVAVSVEQGQSTTDLDTDGDGFVVAGVDEQSVEALDTAFAIGARYTFDLAAGSIVVGAGYQSIDADAVGGLLEDGNAARTADETADIFGISVTGNFDSGFSAVLNYVDGDIAGIEGSNYVGVGAAYSFDALTLAANYGMFDFGDDSEADGFALNVGYDLGGGMSVLAAYSDGTVTDAAGNDEEFDSFSLGLSMSF
ncbi:MAG: porin [Pseudomonadota bacterium]